MSYSFTVTRCCNLQEREPPSLRVENLTDATRATFNANLNWNYSENCTTHPCTEYDICTLLGPSAQNQKDAGHKILYKAICTVRHAGYHVPILPSDFGNTSERSELIYLEEHNYDRFKVYDKYTRRSIAYMKTRGRREPWLYVRCQGEFAKNELREQLAEQFLLAVIEHESTVVDADCIPRLYHVNAVTGDDVEGLGTYFELRRGPKVVGKALCAYRSARSDLHGPTVELFEIASEWQRHGLGSAFLTAVESFFQDLFRGLALDGYIVRFNCCSVTSKKASTWFQERGFRDLRRGEELTKRLFGSVL